MLINCGAAMCWQQCMHFLLCQASARFAASLLVLGSPSNSQLGAGKKAMPASGPAICRKKGSTWSQGGPVRIKHACGRIGSVGACPPTVNSFKAGLFLLCGTCLPFLFILFVLGWKKSWGLYVAVLDPQGMYPAKTGSELLGARLVAGSRRKPCCA